MTSNLGAAHLSAEANRSEHEYAQPRSRSCAYSASTSGRVPESRGRHRDYRRWPAQMHHILEMRLNEVQKLLEGRAISLELTEQAAQLILITARTPHTERAR